MAISPRGNPNAEVPRVPLGRAIPVAAAFGEGARSLSREEIAEALNVRAGTGSANNRVIAAKKFGLLERSSSGGYQRTELGERLAGPGATRADALEAIRHVAVFDALLDVLGPDPDVPEARLLAAIRDARVPADDIERVARVFLRSCGYHAEMAEVRQGDPGGRRQRTGGASAPAAAHAAPTAQVGASRFADHPVVQALLDAAPDQGQVWGRDRQDAWVEALRNAIGFIYPAEAER